jgi:hypothetical protein
VTNGAADLEVTGVETVKIHGERTAAGEARQAQLHVRASYTFDDAYIHYRYDVTARFTGGDGRDLGNVRTTVVVNVRTSYAAEAAHVEQFGQTTGAAKALPALNDALASIASGIGFPRICLPIAKPQPAAARKD